MGKLYKLIGVDGKVYESAISGTLGGHKWLKIYGRLDCHSALRYIAKGQYVKHRVFFKGEETVLLQDIDHVRFERLKSLRT